MQFTVEAVTIFCFDATRVSRKDLCYARDLTTPTSGRGSFGGGAQYRVCKSRMGSGASKEVHVVVVQSKDDGSIDAQIVKQKSRKERKLSS